MIRRYDMSRSDNAPVSNRCMMPIEGPSGNFFVYTGITACNVVITPIRVPNGGIIMVDQGTLGGNGFTVNYEDMPDGRSYVEFFFMVQ
jgi:hypothetical protein